MFREALRQALRNLEAHRRRSILTLLTVAVGIFLVTSVRVFTTSLERSIVRRFERLGTSTVYVHHLPWRFSEGNWELYMRRPRISVLDYEAVRLSLGDQVWAALRYDRPFEKVTYRTHTEETRIVGITEDFHKVFPLELRAGRFFSREEQQRGIPVAIVGARLAQSLFGSEEAIGLEMGYGGRRLRVIGILRPQGSFGGDWDRAVAVPFLFLHQIKGGDVSPSRGDRVLLVRARDEALLPLSLLELRVRGILRQARRLPPRTEDNFAINRQDALLNQVHEVSAYMRSVGLFIAAFSLLVGGFGVANILYIAVRERRAEIGIQRAMGAPRYFILMLFLLEGILLTLIGGGLGILLTASLTHLMDNWAANEGLILSIAAGDLLWGLNVTVLVGLLAAIAPAWSAARLHPIQAIHSAY